MLKHFMVLAVGITSGSWVWSHKTLASWRIVFGRCLGFWTRAKKPATPVFPVKAAPAAPAPATTVFPAVGYHLAAATDGEDGRDGRERVVMDYGSGTMSVTLDSGLRGPPSGGSSQHTAAVPPINWQSRRVVL